MHNSETNIESEISFEIPEFIYASADKRNGFTTIVLYGSEWEYRRLNPRQFKKKSGDERLILQYPFNLEFFGAELLAVILLEGN